MTNFFIERIIFFKRKYTEDKPKDYLLGIDCRLQEGQSWGWFLKWIYAHIEFAVVLLLVT